MKKRSVAAVLLLPLVTFGIYPIFWYFYTKEELNRVNQEQIPTFWLAWVPFISYWWAWRFCVGVEQSTRGRSTAVSAFLLILLLGSIGQAIVQNDLNKYAPQDPNAL